MGIKKFVLPDLGEGVTEGEIIKIKVSEGEAVSMDQPLFEVMTDKASMEVPSSMEGIVQKLEVAEGDIVSVGASLLILKSKEDNTEGGSVSDSLEKQKAGNQESARKTLKSSAEKDFNKVLQKPITKGLKKQDVSLSESLAVPATRRLAEELGLSLRDIQGTGSQGEIRREDLINHIKNRLKSSQVTSVSYGESVPLPPDLTEEKREPIRGIKRLMFESMSLSKATIPHFTIGERAQVEYLVKIKKEMKERLDKQGLRTGYLPFFIRALLPVLKEFPIFNSVYSSKTREIVFRKDVNIGFAVDSPQGLLVPVLKQAQNKSLLEIIKEIGQLAETARQGSIARENLTGASITLSNLGSLGGHYGTPIINPPEMAIMGIYSLYHQVLGSSAESFKEKPFMNFSITCDHRFIDGATAARFLKSFICKIEEPSLLMLE